MFNKKVDSNLAYYLKNNIYKKYRVLIECKHFSKQISSKVTGLKGTVFYCLSHLDLISAELTSKALERLLEFPEVSYVCFDEYVHLCANPTSISSANGIRFSTNYKLSGKNIGIAVIDSGVYPHKDLLQPSNRIKYFNDLVNNFSHPYDDNGHGTFISGLICASGLYSKNIYKGIAPNAQLCCFKAFDAKGKAFVSSILYSIDCILDIYNDFNIKVICLPGELLMHNCVIEEFFNKLFKQCCDKNIIVVVPSGSNYDSQCSIMGFATSKHCITVGGLINNTKNYQPYKYSSFGPYGKLDKPDLAACAYSLTSLNSDTTYISERNGMKLYPHNLETLYTTYSGTSCAAAYVTAIVALLLEDNPSLNFNDICSLLKLSCIPLEFEKFMVGSGIIDFSKLIK